ncbi:MAG TPA: lipid-A-disaccharide synthase [Devosiaceae bacterium]|nr:lipid-A-disaccharide synthase [Devosiaceae bacterium]
MNDALKVFVVAGEPSGDRIGAALVNALRERRRLDLNGVGGPALGEVGLTSLFPMDDLSVLGLVDALRRLPLLLWRIRQTTGAIRRLRPDIVVLIDAQEFSVRVARAVRRFDPALPIVLYGAPTVWAWRPERAERIAGVYTEVLAVLPFEPAVMRRLGGPPTSFVGHPAVDRLAGSGADRNSDLVALFPGSREGELRRNLPTVLEASIIVRRARPETRFVLPTLPGLAATVERAVTAGGASVRVVSARRNAEAAMNEAAIAAAAFGTVTLELAAAGTPMIGFYVGDSVQMRSYRKYRPKYLSLPNIVLDDDVVEELVMAAPDADRLAARILALLDDADGQAAQRAAFDRLRALMRKGEPDGPRQEAAERVLALADAGGQRFSKGT